MLSDVATESFEHLTNTQMQCRAKRAFDVGIIMHDRTGHAHSHPISKASPNYLQSLRPPGRASMATPAQEVEERPAKMRRIHRSPEPLPEVLNMLGCQSHQLVPWTRSRTDICKFGFWIAADLGNVCSHLQLLQTNKYQGEIHCRVESQKRGTPHLHCLCSSARVR